MLDVTMVCDMISYPLSSLVFRDFHPNPSTYRFERSKPFYGDLKQTPLMKMDESGCKWMKMDENGLTLPPFKLPWHLYIPTLVIHFFVVVDSKPFRPY